MSEKALRNELKAPDSFQRLGGEARDWLVNRQTWVAIGVAIALAAGLGIAVVHYFGERGDAQAARALGAALEVMDRVVMAPADATPPIAGMKPPFKSEAEKDQAIVQSLTQFLAAHPGTRAATTAALPLAQAEFRLGHYEAAIQEFEAFVKTAPSEEPLRLIALEGRGLALEALGRTEQALGAFDALSAATQGDFLKGMGVYHRGRILAATGHKEEAAKLFAQVSREAPGSAAGRMGKERLALLAAEGITPPAEAAAAVPDAGSR